MLKGGRSRIAAITAADVMVSPGMRASLMSRSGICFADVAERAGSRAAHGVDRRAVDQHNGVSDGERRARLREGRATADVELVADDAMMRADLALERDLAAPQRAPGPEAAPPDAEEPEQLPERVQSEAARLHGVALEVAAEEPVVGVHAALGEEAAASTVTTDLDDGVDHEQRGKWKAGREACRRIADQLAAREREELLSGEARPGLELCVGHAVPSKRRRYLAQVSPAPTPTTATSSVPRQSSHCIDSTDAAPAPAVLPYHSTLAWWWSSGMPHCRQTASSMRPFA